jgi:L-ascorbate metabolism protein UlaG (beta-lactamase superfamily)
MAAINKITYLGHATLLIEQDGVRLITDPLLRNRVFHLWRRSARVTIRRWSRKSTPC